MRGKRSRRRLPRPAPVEHDLDLDFEDAVRRLIAQEMQRAVTPFIRELRCVARELEAARRRG
jgi:hypothetical protein